MCFKVWCRRIDLVFGTILRSSSSYCDLKYLGNVLRITGIKENENMDIKIWEDIIISSLCSYHQHHRKRSYSSYSFIITRPKPAYGRQGLDWIASFMMFSIWKKQPGTMKNHENRPGTMKSDLEPWKLTWNHENWPGTMKTHLEPWKPNLEPWETMLEQ